MTLSLELTRRLACHAEASKADSPRRRYEGDPAPCLPRRRYKEDGSPRSQTYAVVSRLRDEGNLPAEMALAAKLEPELDYEQLKPARLADAAPALSPRGNRALRRTRDVTCPAGCQIEQLK
jgi:hypothetical protein